MTIRQKPFTFAVSPRMIDLKCNFKTGQQDLQSRLCKNQEENILDLVGLLGLTKFKFMSRARVKV